MLKEGKELYIVRKCCCCLLMLCHLDVNHNNNFFICVCKCTYLKACSVEKKIAGLCYSFSWISWMSCSWNTVMDQIFRFRLVNRVVQRDRAGLVSRTGCCECLIGYLVVASDFLMLFWFSSRNKLANTLCSSQEYKPGDELTILLSDAGGRIRLENKVK